MKQKKLKRIIRKRRLTPEEAEKYDNIRKQIEKELPELIKRHHQRMAEKNGKVIKP